MTSLRPIATAVLLGALLSPLSHSQCNEQTMLASDGVDLGNFGQSIDVDGGQAIVGAPGHVLIEGKAYVQRLSGSAWFEEAILNPSGDLQGSEAGYAVALQGNVAAIGAPGNDTGGVGNAGAIYIFEHQGGSTWTQVASFVEPVLRANGRFGHSMVLDGDQLLVGAPGSGSIKEGLVHVLTRSGNSWSSGAFSGVLTAQDPQTNDFFGASIAIDGAQLAVGAELEDEAATNSGAVYVFERAGSNWNSASSNAKLILSNPQVRDQLGSSVAIEGARILAGARGDANNDPGAAYHWDRLGSTWANATENGAMFPSVIGGLRLGTSVALIGDTAYAGGVSNLTGPVRRFTWNGSMWTDELPISPPFTLLNEAYGTAMALGGVELWVGAVNHREGALRVGATYRYSPREEISYCLTAANSNGGGARLSTCGTSEVALNNLMFVVTGGPDATPGIIFYGGTAIQVPFGDGFRCVGGALQRILPPLTSDAAGTTLFPLDLTSHPANSGTGQINSGSTWNFQYWYRDPGGPGGSGFNLSDAVQVTFTP